MNIKTETAASKREIPQFPAIEGVEFRHIKGFLGYAASSDGRIWSCRERGFGAGLFRAWGPRKSTVGKSGYAMVMLRNCDGQVLKTVHSLIAEAFIGDRPIGCDCRHKDGNRTNNQSENLAWGTRLENEQDKMRHGRTSRGAHRWNARFTDEEVIEIRRMYSTGQWTEKTLAEHWGSSKYAINYIVSGRGWRHLLPGWPYQQKAEK